MKIVLDTNVLVSGLLSPFGAPGKIVQMTSSGALSLCYDVRILTEYQEVLSRAHFKLDSEQISILMEQIKEDGHLVVAQPLPLRLLDVGDEPFLEVAMASKAPLVTGNIKDFPVAKRQGVKIVIPSEFLNIYREEMK